MDQQLRGSLNKSTLEATVVGHELGRQLLQAAEQGANLDREPATAEHRLLISSTGGHEIRKQNLKIPKGNNI